MHLKFAGQGIDSPRVIGIIGEGHRYGPLRAFESFQGRRDNAQPAPFAGTLNGDGELPGKILYDEFDRIFSGMKIGAEPKIESLLIITKALAGDRGQADPLPVYQNAPDAVVRHDMEYSASAFVEIQLGFERAYFA